MLGDGFSSDPVLIHGRACWQCADWLALVAILRESRFRVRSSPELALYCCVASLQLGNEPEAVECFNYVCGSGVDRKSVLPLLLSGASSTAGRLRSLFAGRGAAGEGRVHRWLQLASQEALGARQVPVLLKSRSLRLLQDVPFRGQSPHGRSRRRKYRWKVVDSDAAKKFPELVQQYIYTESLGFWHRENCRDFEYSDGDEVEERLKEILASVSDPKLSSVELVAAQTDWPSCYHLSADRANLLRPFERELQGASVLELGCGCGAVTRYLGELGADVVAVEGSLRRAEIAAMRCHDLPAVNVLCDRAENLPFESRFDFVTLIGVLEYSRCYLTDPNPILAMLECARRYLAPNGYLIIAIENQLGLKYMAGAPEDHGLGVFSGVNDLYDETSVVTFGRKELEAHLFRAGFGAVEVHLPFPDYKLPMLVVHPSGSSETDSKWQLGSLIANTVYYDRQKPADPTFSLEKAWHVVCRNGLAADLANSHLFVASVRKGQSGLVSDKLATHFSPRRASRYFHQVQFLKDEQDNFIVRRMMQADGQLRTETEPYLVGRVHAEALQDVIQRPNWSLEQVKSWASIWIDVLRNHLTEPCAEAEKLGWADYTEWLPANYLDALPRNLLIDASGSGRFFDLEWSAEHCVPMQLVVFRGLMLSFVMTTSIAEPEKKIWSKPDILIDAVMSEFGWDLTGSDFARFMPICERLSRRASGQSCLSDLPVKRYDLAAWHIRQPVRRAAAKTISTLYWQTAGTAFSEENSNKRCWLLNGRLHELTLAIPKQHSTVTALRFDPADRIGYLVIRLLQIEQELGEVIWRWDFREEKPRSEMGVQIVPVPAQEELFLISTGTDPHFELPVPVKVLEQASGANLRVCVLGFETVLSDSIS